MLIGYARISKVGQKLDVQIDCLKKAGCEKIYTEQESGAKESRVVFEQVINSMNKGDTLVIYSFDRLARKTSVFIKYINLIITKLY
jgi:DNA invertase Pin-like site-specific DNA recombinase